MLLLRKISILYTVKELLLLRQICKLWKSEICFNFVRNEWAINLLISATRKICKLLQNCCYTGLTELLLRIQNESLSWSFQIGNGQTRVPSWLVRCRWIWRSSRFLRRRNAADGLPDRTRNTESPIIIAVRTWHEARAKAITYCMAAIPALLEFVGLALGRPPTRWRPRQQSDILPWLVWQFANP